jgi:hypothetical protein
LRWVNWQQVPAARHAASAGQQGGEAPHMAIQLANLAKLNLAVPEWAVGRWWAALAPRAVLEGEGAPC